MTILESGLRFLGHPVYFYNYIATPSANMQLGAWMLDKTTVINFIRMHTVILVHSATMDIEVDVCYYRRSLIVTVNATVKLWGGLIDLTRCFCWHLPPSCSTLICTIRTSKPNERWNLPTSFETCEVWLSLSAGFMRVWLRVTWISYSVCYMRAIYHAFKPEIVY